MTLPLLSDADDDAAEDDDGVGRGRADEDEDDEDEEDDDEDEEVGYLDSEGGGMDAFSSPSKRAALLGVSAGSGTMGMGSPWITSGSSSGVTSGPSSSPSMLDLDGPPPPPTRPPGPVPSRLARKKARTISSGHSPTSSSSVNK